jgi:hypothetical protein
MSIILRKTYSGVGELPEQRFSANIERQKKQAQSAWCYIQFIPRPGSDLMERKTGGVSTNPKVNKDHQESSRTARNEWHHAII